MSSSQLDEMNEARADDALANALGITPDELSELMYGDIESSYSDEGIIYYSYIEIQKDESSKLVLDKVMENVECEDHGTYVTAYIELDQDEDEDDYYDDDYEDDRHSDNEGKKKSTSSDLDGFDLI